MEPEDYEQAPVLEPPERFPDTTSWFESKDPTGRSRAAGTESLTLRGIICQSCCGWPKPPTPAEAERAIQNRDATPRNRAIASTMIYEADFHALVEGEREHVWSLQDIAWWIHELGDQPPDLVDWLNSMSREYMHDLTNLGMTA